MNKINKWLKKIGRRLNRPIPTNNVRIVVAKDIQEHLMRNPNWTGNSIKYPKGKNNIFGRIDGLANTCYDYIDGRKVKFWLQVYESDNAIGDEYIAIFYK
jgi:hypothetical protein